MPAIICDQDHVTHWRNTRGASQPSKCPQCQRPVKRAYFDGYKYTQPPKRESKKTQSVICAVCGASRKYPSRNVVFVEAQTEYAKFLTSVVVPANSHVCWHHLPVQQANNAMQPTGATAAANGELSTGG